VLPKARSRDYEEKESGTEVEIARRSTAKRRNSANETPFHRSSTISQPFRQSQPRQNPEPPPAHYIASPHMQMVVAKEGVKRRWKQPSSPWSFHTRRTTAAWRFWIQPELRSLRICVYAVRPFPHIHWFLKGKLTPKRPIYPNDLQISIGLLLGRG
jgi:hypothetical protein